MILLWLASTLVSPTCVGMNRWQWLRCGNKACKPHVRGDEPLLNQNLNSAAR